MKGCISIWLQTSGSVVTAQASSSICVVKLATPTCLVLPSFLAWHSAADRDLERDVLVVPMDQQQVDVRQLQIGEALVERLDEVLRQQIVLLALWCR